MMVIEMDKTNFTLSSVIVKIMKKYGYTQVLTHWDYVQLNEVIFVVCNGLMPDRNKAIARRNVNLLKPETMGT